MEIIEFEKWVSSKEDPHKLEYGGQRSAQEVYEELKYRLDSQGYLPDEYFLLDMSWENGQKIPKGADLFCTTDYGSSEGVYLDVYLKWYEDGKPITRSFITGKTLGENGNDLDRMFLISSAITKAFHGDHATYARHMKIDGVEDTGGVVFHLSQKEQKVLIDALMEQQENITPEAEHLLRRMTGSITAYMDTVGQQPLRMSDYDKAVLAIRDGELETFQELYQKVRDRAADLLIEAAGRPGAVGQKMTDLVVEGNTFSEDSYHAACRNAIGISSADRIRGLLGCLETCVPEAAPSFRGKLAVYAYLEHRAISKEIISVCTPEQIAASPPMLLEQYAGDHDYHTMSKLVEGGISGGTNSARILHMLTYGGRDNWIAKELLQRRMWVDTDAYNALRACIENGAVDVAKLLLDHGMDFEQYQQWAEHWGVGHDETTQALADYWSQRKAEMEQAAPQEDMGGMSLG